MELYIVYNVESYKLLQFIKQNKIRLKVYVGTDKNVLTFLKQNNVKRLPLLLTPSGKFVGCNAIFNFLKTPPSKSQTKQQITDSDSNEWLLSSIEMEMENETEDDNEETDDILTQSSIQKSLSEYAQKTEQYKSKPLTKGKTIQPKMQKSNKPEQSSLDIDEMLMAKRA